MNLIFVADNVFEGGIELLKREREREREII